MWERVLQWVSRRQTTPPTADGDELAADGTEAETDGGRSVGLFECPPCERTYVSERMDACPECDGDLETLATERDLGYT